MLASTLMSFPAGRALLIVHEAVLKTWKLSKDNVLNASMAAAWIPRGKDVDLACSVFVTSLPWETFFVRTSISKFPKCYFCQPKFLKSHI